MSHQAKSSRATGNFSPSHPPPFFWLLFTTTFSAADTALLDRVCTAAAGPAPTDRAVAAHELRGASGRPGSVIATVRGRERAQSEFQPSWSPGALSKPTAMIPLDRFGDNLDMHAAPCAGVRWHNPLTLAGSMHSVRPVTTGGAPRRAGVADLRKPLTGVIQQPGVSKSPGRSPTRFSSSWSRRLSRLRDQT